MFPRVGWRFAGLLLCSCFSCRRFLGVDYASEHLGQLVLMIIMNLRCAGLVKMIVSKLILGVQLYLL